MYVDTLVVLQSDLRVGERYLYIEYRYYLFAVCFVLCFCPKLGTFWKPFSGTLSHVNYAEIGRKITIG